MVILSRIDSFAQKLNLNSFEFYSEISQIWFNLSSIFDEDYKTTFLVDFWKEIEKKISLELYRKKV
jgi:hypothetical protein